MNKSLISILLLTALTFVVGSCGDDESTPVVPAYLQEGTDTRPSTWQSPNYSLFELTMSVQVQLGDTLAAYQSRADLMCATINDEVRAVTIPFANGPIIYYPLSIGGNGGDQMVSLHYYCDRLHRIYTIRDWSTFNAAAAPTGESGIYRPRFAQ